MSAQAALNSGANAALCIPLTLNPLPVKPDEPEIPADGRSAPKSEAEHAEEVIRSMHGELMDLREANGKGGIYMTTLNSAVDALWKCLGELQYLKRDSA